MGDADVRLVVGDILTVESVRGALKQGVLRSRQQWSLTQKTPSSLLLPLRTKHDVEVRLSHRSDGINACLFGPATYHPAHDTAHHPANLGANRIAKVQQLPRFAKGTCLVRKHELHWMQLKAKQR